MASNMIRTVATRAMVRLIWFDQKTNFLFQVRIQDTFFFLLKLLNKASFQPVLSVVAANRLIHTSSVRSDIDSAAKYIGAGAATVGCAGAGEIKKNNQTKNAQYEIGWVNVTLIFKKNFFLWTRSWYWYRFW